MTDNITCIVEEASCTGCTACLNVCPVGAIRQNINYEGFVYPHVDKEICTHCGLCMKTCPENNKTRRYSSSNGEFYIAQGRERKHIKKSASGGVFYTIANYYLTVMGGVVFGAGFNEENVVCHHMVENVKMLPILQNSKYVQSDLKNVFCHVKEKLDEGRDVLFSGTPCQVAGLNNFLNRDYKNLLTIDIICHGVPSPALLKKELEEASCTWQGKVKSLQFRYKNPLFKTPSSFYMIMRMMKGLPVIRRPLDDPYFNIFSKGIGFRESCYLCQYASLERVGDFTLGDCDSHRLYPDFHPDESNSTVMVNSDKAKKIWDEIISKKCEYCSLDIEKEQEHNKQLKFPSIRPTLRDEVYWDLYDLNWDKFSRKYARRQTFIGRLRAYVAMLAPPYIVKLWGKLNG